MNTRLAYVVFAFSFVVVIYVGLIRNGKDDLESKSMPIQFKRVLEEKKREPAQLSPEPIPSASEKTSKVSIDGFLKKYGSELRIEINDRGHIVSLQGTDLPAEAWTNSQRVEGFSTRDEDQVIARAREILSDAHSILGISEEMPLIDPKVSSTPLHAQVVFYQSVGGVPVVPGGTVSVMVGSQGELKGISSDYFRHVQVANAPKIAENNARPILWVQSSDPVARLLYAYERREDGFQIITDAENGRILLRRNRRIH